MGTLRVTILGCGSSGGVPRIGGGFGGDWGACDPADPRNRRTRCGLLLQRWAGAAGDPALATTVLVDTSPDLREQLLAADVRRCDGVFYTHDHADQAHGIDDLRALAIRMRRRIPVVMDAETADTLMRRFDYCFEGRSPYPAILDAQPFIAPGESATLEGPGGPITALALAQDHGERGSLGYRFGAFGYANDVVELPAESLAAFAGLELFVVDALRYTPHPSHAHVDKALGWIAAARPRRAVLTNLHVDLDFAELSGRLPAGVEPAVDGWTMDLADP